MWKIASYATKGEKMKYLYYERNVHSYISSGCIPVKKIVYVEGSRDGSKTHVTLSTGEVLTIDISISDVLNRLDSMG